LKCDTPSKFKDPGVTTISCFIGNHKVERAFLDLGSSINLIPYVVYLELGLGEMKPSKHTVLPTVRFVLASCMLLLTILVWVSLTVWPNK